MRHRTDADWCCVHICIETNRLAAFEVRPSNQPAGDLKLAYAQFEELETFARFGARLDADSQKGITHGQRIRACLKQPERSPMPVLAQVAIVLALTAGLFDAVPLDRMAAAEQALRIAVDQRLPHDLAERLLHADTLAAADRAAVVALARRVIEPFLKAAPAAAA